MSYIQRISLLAGVLAATVVCFIVFQSATQEVETQTEGDSGTAQPTYSAPSDEEFAAGRIIVSLEEDAAQANLAAINGRNDARTEEALPASDVSVVDLPRDLPVREAVERYEASRAYRVDQERPSLLPGWDSERSLLLQRWHRPAELYER